MKTIKILVMIIIVTFSSCELSKELDYNTIYEGDKIIVHGFISPQNGVQLIIKKSVPPDRVSVDDKIENARVTLLENGKEVLFLNRENDYLFNAVSYFTPAIDNIYSIKVQTENFEETYSTSQSIFAPVAIDTLQLHIDKDNYYKNLVVSFTNTVEFAGSFYLKVYYYPNGKIDSTNTRAEFFNPYGLIDNIVPGKNSIEKQLYDDFDSLKVELYTLSPDLVKFLDSFRNYDFSKEDPFFEQTFPVYSNIENGYGIFASYSVYSKTISN